MPSSIGSLPGHCSRALEPDTGLRWRPRRRPGYLQASRAREDGREAAPAVEGAFIPGLGRPFTEESWKDRPGQRAGTGPSANAGLLRAPDTTGRGPTIYNGLNAYLARGARRNRCSVAGVGGRYRPRIP